MTKYFTVMPNAAAGLFSLAAVCFSYGSIFSYFLLLKRSTQPKVLRDVQNDDISLF